MNKKNAPTMKDVAREAGVALGTVSKVINGLPVGDAYKEKVEAAIKALDYEVNTYARAYHSQYHQPFFCCLYRSYRRRALQERA